MKSFAILLLSAVLLFASGVSNADKGSKKKGLNDEAKQELIDAGVTRYVDQFAPAVSKMSVQAGRNIGSLPIRLLAPCVSPAPHTRFSQKSETRKS